MLHHGVLEVYPIGTRVLEYEEVPRLEAQSAPVLALHLLTTQTCQEPMSESVVTRKLCLRDVDRFRTVLEGSKCLVQLEEYRGVILHGYLWDEPRTNPELERMGPAGRVSEHVRFLVRRGVQVGDEDPFQLGQGATDVDGTTRCDGGHGRE